MGRSRYLVRFSPDRIALLCEGGGPDPNPTLFALTSGSDPETSDINLGKSPHITARALRDPVIYEAVNLHHDLPPSFYEGLHEQWLGALDDLEVRYSLADEVEDVAARLPRDPRWPEVARRARREQEAHLRAHGFSNSLSGEALLATFMGRLVPFYDAAAEHGEAVLFHAD